MLGISKPGEITLSNPKQSAVTIRGEFDLSQAQHLNKSAEELKVDVSKQYDYEKQLARSNEIFGS